MFNRDTYDYKAGDRAGRLVRDEEWVAVRFAPQAPASVRHAAAVRAGLGAYAQRIELPGEPFILMPIAERDDQTLFPVKAVHSQLNASPAVLAVRPVFRSGLQQVTATDRILVGFDQIPEVLPDSITQLGAIPVAQFEQGLVLELPAYKNPFTAAGQLAWDPAVRFAEPDFVTVGRHLALTDPCHRLRRGCARADYHWRSLEVIAALETVETAAACGISVAVLADGVDSAHPELASAFTAGYDAICDDRYQEPERWDILGTASAGLVAQCPGKGCRLHAARLALSDRPGAPWVARSSWVIRAIDWAWQTGADVLLYAWGPIAPSAGVAAAVERAATRGRRGRGCLIVAAAGDEKGAVGFPAHCPGVTAVAASTPYDTPKTHNSEDGVIGWASAGGPDIALAAPGLGLRTTDVSGCAGADCESDELVDFQGTAAAAALVAGTAGRMLAGDPQLTRARLHALLCSSADPVGPLAYRDGRNDAFGHGRLNVAKALSAARPRRPALRLVGAG